MAAHGNNRGAALLIGNPYCVCGHGAGLIQLHVPAQPFETDGVGLERVNGAVLAQSSGNRDRIIAEVGAHIEHHTAGMHRA